MKQIKQLVITLLIFAQFTSCLSLGGYLESRYVKIADNVLPSVVEIIAIGLDGDVEQKWLDFFQDQEDFKNEDRNTGVGSGVIVESLDNDYYIITNNHVVGNLTEVSVLLYNDKIVEGTVLGVDNRFDIAVIKITSTEKLEIANLDLSGNIKVGQFVAALGNPMSYVQTISMGIISNIGRFGGPKENLSNYIQTDAAINHGNSGGPLVNMKQEVIGINTWISSPSSGNVGLGFAMPIENIYPSFRSIVDYGKVSVGWAGISSYGLPNSDFYLDKSGAFINQVVLHSPAYLLGLKAGDIITKINNNYISSSDELFLNISLLKPTEIANLVILRGDNEISLSLVLGESEDNVLEVSKNIFPGFVLGSSEDIVSIIQILPKSVGLASGFLKGDTINSLNGKKIKNIEDFYMLLNKGKNMLIISREDNELELELIY
ncbi:MAG: trypsin-like peptidase domain-containing protein [Spirochaetaceae bacterium]